MAADEGCECGGNEVRNFSIHSPEEGRQKSSAGGCSPSSEAKGGLNTSKAGRLRDTLIVWVIRKVSNGGEGKINK